MKKFIIRRLIKPFIYALEGLRACWRLEEAFRIELSIIPWLIILALQLKIELTLKLLVIFSSLLVILVELLNTGIEKTVDLISSQHHPLAKIIKDVASAAVFVALVNFGIMWLGVLSKIFLFSL